MSCFVVVFSESKCMTEQKKKSWYYTPLYNFSKITTRVCISEVLMRKKSKNAKLLLPFLKSSEAKQAWMKSAGMWIVENKIRIIIYKKKSQFFGRTIWMLVLCSEESAAVRHALGQRLALRRQVPLSARTFPCTGHTLPWHSKGVALVLSPVSSTPVNAPLRSSAIYRLSCAPLLSEAAAAAAAETTNKERTRSSGDPENDSVTKRDRQEWGWQCLDEGGKDSSPLRYT